MVAFLVWFAIAFVACLYLLVLIATTRAVYQELIASADAIDGTDWRRDDLP